MQGCGEEGGGHVCGGMCAGDHGGGQESVQWEGERWREVDGIFM